MFDDFEVTLIFHDRPVDMRAAAARCPRCARCNHHPNAHARTGCSVTVERAGNRTAKCGCSEVQMGREAA